MKRCVNCGKEIEDQTRFCPGCGSAQSAAQPQYTQPQPPVYQNPGYPYPQQPPRNPNDGKGLSITALVLGICGVALFWVGVLNFILLACDILGIIFGFMGRKKSVAAYGKPSGLATAGFVLGIVGTSICALGVLSYLACFGSIGCAYCEVLELISSI